MNKIEIQKGYKQTELGVIPEDWELAELGNISKIIMGQSPKSIYYNRKNIGLPLVQGNADIRNRKTIIRNFTSEITKKCSKNSIIMTVRAPVGEIAKADFDCCLGRGVCSLEYKNEYLYHKLILLEKDWEKLSRGSTFDSINSKEVKEILISFPSNPKEQEAIAKVLSDTDELIQSIEKLIEKKKKIKEGTMQELLTGKKRLEGFKENWEIKKIKDLLDFEQPVKYIVKNTEYVNNGKTPVLTANKSFILGCTEENEGIFNNVPVIIFDDFTILSKYVDFPFKVKSSAIKILKLKDKNTNLKFIYELMQTINFQIGDHKRYYISEYQELNIKVPFKPEQEAIAQILSDMDTELELLNEKLDKYRKIKEGMMQQLLTGKIRLI